MSHFLDKVNHPQHYGGADDPFEAIKVIDAWKLSFCLGNVLKYIRRLGHKQTSDSYIEDLKKAAWYLNHEIELLTKEIRCNTSKSASLTSDTCNSLNTGGATNG